jgi:hypothetical protein
MLTGVAFVDVIDDELFPTVGIDAMVHVQFNFGKEEFRFDLANYIATNTFDLVDNGKLFECCDSLEALQNVLTCLSER